MYDDMHTIRFLNIPDIITAEPHGQEMAAKIVRKARRRNAISCICSQSFCPHWPHILHFESSRSYADISVVSFGLPFSVVDGSSRWLSPCTAAGTLAAQGHEVFAGRRW